MAESNQPKTPPPSKNLTTANNEKEEILVVAESLLEQYRVQILVGTVLLVSIIVAYFQHTQDLRNRTDHAWEEFSRIIEDSNLENVVTNLENLIQIKAVGTDVEPWALWQLAQTYGSLHKFQLAYDKLVTLKNRFPKHYLNTRREVAGLEESTPVAKSLKAIETEIDFWKNRTSPESKNNPIALLATSKGELRFELYESHCPNVVKMFVHLSETGFYENMKFRDTFNNRVYCGSLMSDGKGNAGYTIPHEFSDQRHQEAGALAMKSNPENDELDGQFYFTTASLPPADSKLEDQRNVVFGRLLEEDKTKNNYLVLPARLEKLKHHEEFKKLAEAPTDEAQKESGRKQQEQLLEALSSLGQKTFWNASDFEAELNKAFADHELSISKELMQGIVNSLSGPILTSFTEKDVLFKVTILNKRPDTVYVPTTARGLEK